MDKRSLKDFSKEERRDFYQYKYEYYAVFMVRLITVSVIAYLFFFVTDCLIVGRFNHETLLSRIIIVLPFSVYLWLSKNVKDYRVMVPITYLMIHMIIWCTDWATYLLPDRKFAMAGMIVMNLIFVCAGFGSPLWGSIIGHAFVLVDIGVADLFIHYDDLTMMYLFNLPCVVAVCAMHKMMQRVHVEQYIVRKQLENLVVQDQLTKVNNRNKLKELSNIRGELIAFSDIPLSMLLLDIDYFKQVNDEYGHEAGDVVLVHLAKVLKETLRITDYVIRWGGEEFLIILPGCVVEQAEVLAEKIRKKVEESDSGICPITISVGVAQHEPGDYHITIKNADEALYTAKRNGRNQVAVYKKMNVQAIS